MVSLGLHVPDEPSAQGIGVGGIESAEAFGHATISKQVDAAASRAAEARARTSRALVRELFFAALSGLTASAAAAIVVLGIAGAAVVGPLVVAAGGLALGMAVAKQVIDRGAEGLGIVLADALRSARESRTKNDDQQPASLMALSAALAEQRAAIQSLSPRHRRA